MPLLDPLNENTIRVVVLTREKLVYPKNITENMTRPIKEKAKACGILKNNLEVIAFRSM